MKKLFRIDSPFVQKMSLVFDLMLINVLWLVCCIPIVTIGASTTAMYAAVHVLAEDSTGYVRKFFHTFRSCFVQSTFAGLVVALGVLVLGVDLLGLKILPAKTHTLLVVFFWLGAVMLSMSAAHLPILLFRYENTLRNMLRNSIRIGWSALPVTAAMAALDLIPWLILWFRTDLFWWLGFLWMLLYFSFSAYLNVRLFRRFLQPYLEPSESLSE